MANKLSKNIYIGALALDRKILRLPSLHPYRDASLGRKYNILI
jgi:hypothetical protein